MLRSPTPSSGVVQLAEQQLREQAPFRAALSIRTPHPAWRHHRRSLRRRRRRRTACCLTIRCRSATLKSSGSSGPSSARACLISGTASRPSQCRPLPTPGTALPSSLRANCPRVMASSFELYLRGPATRTPPYHLPRDTGRLWAPWRAWRRSHRRPHSRPQRR